MAVACRRCSFTTDKTAMFSRVRAENGKKGHAEPNLCLGAWHLTHDSSFKGTKEIPTFLKMPTITESSLATIIQELKVPMAELGRETLDDNCSKISRLMEALNVEQLTVSTDTCYNNPAKGRCFQQNGTQSCSPMHEFLTEKKLTLSIQSLNQHCTCKGQCKGYKKGCPANVPVGETVGTCEGHVAKLNIESIESKGIPIGSVVSDGTHQVLKFFDGRIHKVECAVHKARALRRKVYSLTLSDDCTNCGDLINKLSVDVTDRCKREFTLCRKKYPENDSKFFAFIERVRTSLIDCIGGDHSSCRKNLLSCAFAHCASGDEAKSRQLEYKLNKKDKKELQVAIDVKLCRKAVKEQSMNANTNIDEAFHRRTQKLNPKHKTNKSTFECRNLHAVTEETHGHGEAAKMFLQKIGVDLPREPLDMLARLDRRESKISALKKTNQYKRRRHELQVLKYRKRQERRDNKAAEKMEEREKKRLEREDRARTRAAQKEEAEKKRQELKEMQQQKKAEQEAEKNRRREAREKKKIQREKEKEERRAETARKR